MDTGENQHQQVAYVLAVREIGQTEWSYHRLPTYVEAKTMAGAKRYKRKGDAVAAWAYHYKPYVSPVSYPGYNHPGYEGEIIGFVMQEVSRVKL